MMNEKQEAALRQAREALKESHPEAYRHTIAAIDEALADQPAQPCGYPYCGCNSKAWCKVGQQSGLKQVIELYDSPEQPAQQQKPDGRVISANCKYATVQWLHQTSNIGGGDPKNSRSWPIGGEDVYLSPPASKPWAGLTDEDHQAAWDAMNDYEDYDTYGAVLEAKLREKNA